MLCSQFIAVRAAVLQAFGAELLRTREIAEVDVGGVRLTNADGIVLRGRTLWVVQNFSRRISTLKLRHNFMTATLEEFHTMWRASE